MKSFSKFVGAGLAALVAAVAVPGAALADPAGSCTAVPDPVPVGVSYTVTASGVSLNTAFVVRIQQAGMPAREVFATADSAGNASTEPQPAPTEPGAATAVWKKLIIWPSGGGPIITYGAPEATCDWSIVA